MLQPRELPQQRQVLKILGIISCLAAQLYLAYNVYRGLYTLALVEAAVCLLSGYVVWCTYFHSKLNHLPIIFLLILYSLLNVCLTLEVTHPSIFAWVLAIPVLSYLMLGRRLGFGVTALFILVGLMSYLSRGLSNPEFLNLGSVLNISFSTILIWVFTHIYEGSREQSEDRLTTASAIDVLTGMLNRFQLKAVFSRELSRCMRYEQTLSLVIFDIDHFKSINDNYGHDTGDKVLQYIGDLIHQNIRGSDYAFRIGDEEFCLLLGGADQYQAVKIINQLRARLSQCKIEGHEKVISITLSAGVSQLAVDATDFEALYAAADQRMYLAKAHGRNRVVFSDSCINPDEIKANQIISLG